MQGGVQVAQGRAWVCCHHCFAWQKQWAVAAALLLLLPLLPPLLPLLEMGRGWRLPLPRCHPYETGTHGMPAAPAQQRPPLPLLLRWCCAPAAWTQGSLALALARGTFCCQ